MRGLHAFHLLLCMCAEGQVVYNPETTEILATGNDVRASVWVVGILCLGYWILLL